jgi:hypothetical protein
VNVSYRVGFDRVHLTAYTLAMVGSVVGCATSGRRRPRVLVRLTNACPFLALAGPIRTVGKTTVNLTTLTIYAAAGAASESLASRLVDGRSESYRRLIPFWSAERTTATFAGVPLMSSVERMDYIGT